MKDSKFTYPLLVFNHFSSMISSDDMKGDIYEKSNEFAELLESKLTVSGITLGSMWTDSLDAWGIVIDRSSGSVSEVVGNVQGS